jgi:hypothetical protein
MAPTVSEESVLKQLNSETIPIKVCYKFEIWHPAKSGFGLTIAAHTGKV